MPMHSPPSTKSSCRNKRRASVRLLAIGMLSSAACALDARQPTIASNDTPHRNSSEVERTTTDAGTAATSTAAGGSNGAPVGVGGTSNTLQALHDGGVPVGEDESLDDAV